MGIPRRFALPVDCGALAVGRQKRRLNGPAKNRQTNSHLPVGITSGVVKKYIKVKNIHRDEEGMLNQPRPRREEIRRMGPRAIRFPLAVKQGSAA